MMITNEWNHISTVREAIGQNVVLIFPDAQQAEALVYSDDDGNIKYEFSEEDQHYTSPVFWRFK